MYVLPQHLRPKYKELLGKLLENPKKGELLAAVKNRTCVVCIGDMVTYTMITNDIHVDMTVVDYFTCREEFAHADAIRRMDADRKKVRNAPGTISDEAFETVKEGMKMTFPRERPLLIEVDGEEDLLLMPAVLYAPKGSVLLYGEPNAGIVAVYPDDELKRKMLDFLGMMEEM